MPGARTSQQVLLAAALSLAAAFPHNAQPSSLTVPDDAPTIQAALDALVDTVLVRPGAYAESPVTRRSGWLMATPDDPSNMPVLGGLTIQDAAGPVEIRGLRVSARVQIRSTCCPEIRFAGCDLMKGIVDVSDEVNTLSVWFEHCSLAGPMTLAARHQVRVDSCQVTGGLVVSPSPGARCSLAVVGCAFQGNPLVTAIEFGSVECTVVGNTIRAYGRAVRGGNQYPVHVANNLIEDCPSRGISVASAAMLTVVDNVIRRCGWGIEAYSFSEAGMTIRGNQIDGGGSGIIVYSDAGDVTGNVVSGCASSGIFVGGSTPSRILVSQNTSCFNVRSGFVWDGVPGDQSAWTRNIGFANGEYGIHWRTPDPGAAVSCNNWFANQAGAVEGQPPSSGDFSVDPLFCDAAAGDFRLNSASPLLDWPGCGQVGALGLGCGETPTLVLRFTAGRVSEGVRVVWEIAAGAPASEVWIERSEEPARGPWSRPVTERTFEGRAIAELDRSADPDRNYWYRLLAREGAETIVLGPAIEVAGATRGGFGLALLGPNPGAGPVRVEFSLARPAAIEIDVVDVQGRRIASLARGPWPAGSHAVEWSGRAGGGGQTPPGHYVVRYRHPGGAGTRRFVRLY